jgi:hypothetical protein
MAGQHDHLPGEVALMAKTSKSKAESSKSTAHKGTVVKTKSPTWTENPAAHDYPSAASYLRLIAAPNQVEILTSLLSTTSTIHQHAKDILRAAGLPLLPVDDPEVAKDLGKVSDGIALAPVLLVRGDFASARPLQIADGYHRVCASYHIDEDTEIPCRLAVLPAIVL